VVRVSKTLPNLYLNGAVPAAVRSASVAVDRSFLFGDAVYEVMPVYGGRPFRLREHLETGLNRSSRPFAMPAPRSHPEWPHRARLGVTPCAETDCHIYIQVSPGSRHGATRVA